MIVTIINVALHIEHSRSLKEKRRALKSIIEKVKNHYNVSIAEIGDQNLWQKASVGISYVALSDYQAKKQALVIKNFIETLDKATISQYNFELVKSGEDN